MLHLKSCRMDNNDQLDERNHKDDGHHHPVPENLDKFLLYYVKDGSHIIYASLILNFLTLSKIKNVVKPISINVSFQT